MTPTHTYSIKEIELNCFHNHRIKFNLEVRNVCMYMCVLLVFVCLYIYVCVFITYTVLIIMICKFYTIQLFWAVAVHYLTSNISRHTARTLWTLWRKYLCCSYMNIWSMSKPNCI